MTTCEPGACQVGGSALVFPLFGDHEQQWPDALRVVLYSLGLAWLFVGVAILADVFMSAIERITSTKKRVYDTKEGRTITVKVWNDTVANLSLMALGSSAPEILLSMIELMGKGFYSGSLGPSTIVGSAAFNLLCISAVCVAVIPEPEVRKIKDLGVFSVTATFSIFAYLWLFFCVQISTPDIIDIWEAILSLCFFPILVITSYCADKGCFNESRRARHPNLRIVDNELPKEEVAMMEMQILLENGMLSEEELANQIQTRFGSRTSNNTYRVNKARSLRGPTRTGSKQRSTSKSKFSIADCDSVTPAEGTSKDPAVVNWSTSIIEFQSSAFAVQESIGTLSLMVHRGGNLHKRASVEYKSRDGTALAGFDYEAVAGRIDFSAGESKKLISIRIIDDDAYEDSCEDTEEFFIDLFNPASDEKGCHAKLGHNSTATIRIIDDDDPGVLEFREENMEVEQGTLEDKTLHVTVVRKGGCRGEVKCRYWTEDGTAYAGCDYVPLEGLLTMVDGQASANIDVTINPGRGRYERVELFRVYVSDPTGGARICQYSDGGALYNICTVHIKSDKARKERIDKIVELMQLNVDELIIGGKTWKKRLHEAVVLTPSDGEDRGGNDAGDDAAEPSAFDWFIHIITVFWKVLFAFIPPVTYCGGWACFWISLALIGVVTALIGDLAELLGCLLRVPDSVTAITFVALGTSLPDLFASKTAACGDPYADASIGNVTGSNSVNVFLGLGMPWVIGSVYWAIQGSTPTWANRYPDIAAEWPDGGKFVVVGSNLGFSLAVYSSTAVACISILVARRYLLGGELGGPTASKYCTSATLVLLWCLYISLSSWNALSEKGACG